MNCIFVYEHPDGSIETVSANIFLHGDYISSMKDYLTDKGYELTQVLIVPPAGVKIRSLSG